MYHRPMLATLAAIVLAAMVATCSSRDEFSQCVDRCMSARDPLPGGECVRLCEHLMKRGGEEASDGDSH